MKTLFKKKNKKVLIIVLLLCALAILLAGSLIYKKLANKVQNRISDNVKAGCQEEGLASEDTLTYFDQQTQKPKTFLAGPPTAQITDAQKWEKDAYLVAMIHGSNLETKVQPVSFLYASSCTSHFLLLTDEKGNNKFTAQVITSQDPVLYVTPSLFVDLAQVPFNAPLDLSTTTTTVPAFIQIPNGNSVTIQDKTFAVDSYAIQQNLSKKYGQIYQVMYMKQGHLAAVVTYTKDGNIMTLSTY